MQKTHKGITMTTSADEILKKYSKKLESEIGPSNTNYSSEYLKFREETIPEITTYEKWAKSLGSLIKVKVAEKDRLKMQRYLNIAHNNATPSQAFSLSLSCIVMCYVKISLHST